jgi:hypothetical protein
MRRIRKNIVVAFFRAAIEMAGQRRRMAAA